MQKTIPDEVLLALALKNSGGGGGGTSDYESLDNLPKINNVTLLGNKTAGDLGLQSELTAGDNITIEDGVISSTSVAVDDILSDESENPVQNKIINTALSSKANISDNENINAVQTNGTLPSLSVDSEGYINFDAGALVVLKSINVITRPYTIPSWSTGTDAEIIEALNKHYAGDIDLTQVWQVGDERTVHLSAMSADGVGESHVEQDITMVILNKGGKELVTPINNISECAFIVGQKNLFVAPWGGPPITAEGGYMDTDNASTITWDNCKRRAWCNSIYRNAIPITLREIFKEHINRTAADGTTVANYIDSHDYFALASEKELFGRIINANSIESVLSQFEYYQNADNLIKYLGDDDIGKNSYFSSYWTYWMRSPWASSSGNTYFLRYSDKNSVYNSPQSSYGIAPYGVI